MSMNYYVNDRFSCYPRPLTPFENQYCSGMDQCACTDEIILTKIFDAALNSVTFSTVSSDVVESLKPNSVSLVKNVNLSNTDVVTQLAESTVTVSAPIIAAITPIVSQISTITPDNGVVTHIDTTAKDVIESITPLTKDVVTGFGEPESVTGVIAGVNSVSTATPTAFQLPSINCSNAGVMQVTLPVGIIDGVNPTQPIVLNVQVGGENVSYGGNQQIFALTSNENLLSGVNGNPTTTTIPLIGKPITQPFIYDMASTTTPVLHSVETTTTGGSLVESINADIVNTIATPTTVEVLENVNPITKNITTVNSIDSVTPDKLFAISTKKMLESASLSSTSGKFIKDIL